MRCPVDDNELAITERQGIEIDYCPKCRGVWLDRGELDKLIERTAAAIAVESPAPRRGDDRGRGDDGGRVYEHGRGEYDRKKRKKSLLSEIFDF